MLFEMLKATFFFLIAAFTVGHCLPIREPVSDGPCRLILKHSEAVCLSHQPSCDWQQPSLIPCHDSQVPICSCVGEVLEVLDNSSGKCVKPSECDRPHWQNDTGSADDRKHDCDKNETRRPASDHNDSDDSRGKDQGKVQEVVTVEPSTEVTITSIPYDCSFPHVSKEWGDCSSPQYGYVYDIDTRSCKIIQFCGRVISNRNIFFTLKECQTKCGGI